MPDSRLQRLGEVLVDYSTRVAQDELVFVDAHRAAAPLIREVYKNILRAGGRPLVRIRLEELNDTLLSEGSDEQIEWVNPSSWDLVERADVLIALEAYTNTKRLSNIEPARQARFGRAHQAVSDRFLERAAAGELRWVGTVLPTNAAAQDARMSLVEYEDFVYRAGFLDRDDPVGEWRAFGEELERVSAFLSDKGQLRVVGDDTDLTLAVAGRIWIPAAGDVNFPDGEVFTGPIETSVEGSIRFTYPASFHGREVQDVRLRFEGGEVVEVTARRGEDFLREMIGMDDGARRVGEFAFGMNEAVTEFTGHPLFDEKIGGTVHLALGKSYPETGGRNESGLHWDLVCDLRTHGEVYADGELVYRDGKFLDGVLD
ncbi:MAG: aminopeptidase [Actinobacteria bacterium]|nr:aminopeptidase [Actinomycetota bacterium]